MLLYSVEYNALKRSLNMPKNQYAIARRSIWYLLRNLLVLALIVVLCLAAFVTAMNISNIYILVTEGLELRAGYILQGGEIASLTEYFTESFVAQDAALYAGTYDSFSVTNFIYKIEVKSFFMLPGDSSATVKVYEKLLSLSGSPKEGTDQDAQLPQWTPATYNVKLKRVKGRWYINDMILLEQNPTEKPLPTPDMTGLATPEP